MKSKIFASLHAASISSSVTSSWFFVAPSRTLKRMVPAYSVYRAHSLRPQLLKETEMDILVLEKQVLCVFDTLAHSVQRCPVRPAIAIAQ